MEVTSFPKPSAAVYAPSRLYTVPQHGEQDGRNPLPQHYRHDTEQAELPVATAVLYDNDAECYDTDKIDNVKSSFKYSLHRFFFLNCRIQILSSISYCSAKGTKSRCVRKDRVASSPTFTTRNVDAAVLSLISVRRLFPIPLPLHS